MICEGFYDKSMITVKIMMFIRWSQTQGDALFNLEPGWLAAWNLKMDYNNLIRKN